MVLSLCSPTQIGVYKNGKLSYALRSEEKAGDYLACAFSDILQKEKKIDEILYANGPGSFLGLKLAYLFLSALAMTQAVNFFAIDIFEITREVPANKGFVFIKNKGSISTVSGSLSCILLPKHIDNLSKSSDLEPFYFLPPTAPCSSKKEAAKPIERKTAMRHGRVFIDAKNESLF